MKIILSPVRGELKSLYISVTGATVEVCGKSFDLSALPAGGSLPASALGCKYILGQVSRGTGGLELTALLPIPANYTQEQAFPVPITVTTDGPVPLPVESAPWPHVTEGVIDWSMMVTAEDIAREQAEELLRQQAAVEVQWVASELLSIENQLMALEEEEAGSDEANPLPGARTDWLKYRSKVRAWKPGAAGYPDPSARPERPS